MPNSSSRESKKVPEYGAISRQLCVWERATELADDFAAYGQKRLTGHPACQLSQAPGKSALKAYRASLDTRPHRPTQTLSANGFPFFFLLFFLSFCSIHLTVASSSFLDVFPDPYSVANLWARVSTPEQPAQATD